MLTKREFYIDGAWTAPARENDFEVINPSDEEVCAVISLGDQADLDAAVAAATRAFEPWAATPIAERIALVERIHALYVERFDEIAEAMSLEMGAPIDFSKASQADAGEWHIANFLDAVKKFKFERPLDGDAPDNRILYEPVGVCGLITPWNWPMNQVTLKVIPAMLTGCTMVLKPSEIAPLSSMAFAQIIHDAGTPAGVPASWIIWAKAIDDNGAISDGLRTMVQPVNIAGMTLRVTWFIGQFQGVIRPQTPTGSYRIRLSGASPSSGRSNLNFLTASRKFAICHSPASAWLALEKSIGAPISRLIASAISSKRST